MLRKSIVGFVVGISVAAGLITGISAALSLTSFESGRPISATTMNENFRELEQRIAQLEASKEVPPGTVIAFAGAGQAPPEGWLWCDGQAVSKNEFPGLFAALGTSYGGTGNPMFQVPDYRGRFLRGLDEGAGRDPDAGRALGSEQADAFQSHWHKHSYKLQAKAATGNYTSVAHWQYSGAGEDNDSIRDAVAAGSGGTPRTASETRPVNIAVRYCIKY